MYHEWQDVIKINDDVDLLHYFKLKSGAVLMISYQSYNFHCQNICLIMMSLFTPSLYITLPPKC